jgi:hypothetical protein
MLYGSSAFALSGLLGKVRKYKKTSPNGAQALTQGGAWEKRKTLNNKALKGRKQDFPVPG